MQTLRHLLVAVDFSATADAALDAAVQLASAGGARITIVHVCDPEAARAPVQAQLDGARTRVLGRGVDVATLLRGGRPADKINNAAAEVGASLIVLGRSGDLAEVVLRTANRPVLVVGEGSRS